MMLWPTDSAARSMFERITATETEVATQDFVDKHKKNRERGLIAGGVFWELLNRIATKKPGGKNTSVYRDAPAMFELPKPISSKKIEDEIWRDFRSVAHLWAAFMALVAQRDRATVFPSTLSDLPLFLGSAEYFRVKGETTKTKHRRDTILRPGNSVRLPPDLESAVHDLELSAIGWSLPPHLTA